MNLLLLVVHDMRPEQSGNIAVLSSRSIRIKIVARAIKEERDGDALLTR